ncbi:MAG: polysaccharide biosynthesis protein, partial [Muribaculaceae bacterium]|nr:polysaccharide biosynthesis protein [Muribaculaceae bacterium]
MFNPFHKSLSWYFSKKALPYWSILIIDSVIVFLSLLLGHALAAKHAVFSLHSLIIADLILTCCFLISFRLLSTYSGVVRYSSFVDLIRIAKSCLLGLILSIGVQYLFSFTSWFMPQSVAVLVVGSLFAVCIMWAERIWVKYLYDSTIRRGHTKPVFIYGTKAGGIAIAKSINSSENSPYLISGFITDGTDMLDKRLMNVRIYPNDENLVKAMKKAHADILLVSPLKSKLLQSNDIMVDSLINAGIKILMVPPEQEWDGKSDLNYSQLKEVNVEDLLPRDKIEVDMNQIGNLLRGKRILITGAAGSIGSEMVRQIALYSPAELILIDQAETPLHDIR